jgi:hypothetical protein
MSEADQKDMTWKKDGGSVEITTQGEMANGRLAFDSVTNHDRF